MSKEIIMEEFYEKFPQLFNSCDGREGYDENVTDKVKEHISKVYYQVRLETIKEVEDMLDEDKSSDGFYSINQIKDSLNKLK